MATYKEIQEYIKGKYSVGVKTCWIADIKDAYGLTRGPAPNRQGTQRSNPCPPNCRRMIEDALKHFRMIR